jgi:two-component system phosphate regulon response regulator PhoB
LLVDDDPDLQIMIREMLDAIGLEVEAVADGERALDRLVLEPFDLVVLDWNLPGMSGLELCREVRRHPRLAGTPILFLTGQSGSRDLVDAFAAGADDFVAKPFRAPELGARLLALLRRAKIGLSVPPPAG